MSVSWKLLFAGTITSTLPDFITFPIMERYRISVLFSNLWWKALKAGGVPQQ